MSAEFIGCVRRCRCIAFRARLTALVSLVAVLLTAPAFALSRQLLGPGSLEKHLKRELDQLSQIDAFALDVQSPLADQRVEWDRWIRPLLSESRLPVVEQVDGRSPHLKITVRQVGPHEPRWGGAYYSARMTTWGPGRFQQRENTEEDGPEAELSISLQGPGGKLLWGGALFRVTDGVSGPHTQKAVLEHVREFIFLYKLAHGASLRYKVSPSDWAALSLDDKLVFIYAFSRAYAVDEDLSHPGFIELLDRAFEDALREHPDWGTRMIVWAQIERTFGRQALQYAEGITEAQTDSIAELLK